jgi:hypothetical protein
VQAFGADPCKANVHCDAATSTCAFEALDKDHDGHAPIVCGGDDCNDGDPTIYPGAPEICDGKDNGCTGMAADTGATCPGLGVCTGGVCVCQPANTCGASCVDKSTDENNCGLCGNVCPSGATCQNGACVCSTTATICNGLCVDTKNDPANCNGCGQACAPGYACQNSACTCTKTSCGGACVDTQIDLANCGACGKTCTSQCLGGVCQPSCTDFVKNAQETDVDCGGPTCAKCSFGKICLSGADCASGQCVTGKCQGGFTTLSFGPGTVFAVDAQPWSIAVADFDGNGKLLGRARLRRRPAGQRHGRARAEGGVPRRRVPVPRARRRREQGR